jgi:hypothetical protein
MFQDNGEKQEQIRKLQEELDKKSRVVKPQARSAADANNNSTIENKAQKNKSSITVNKSINKPVASAMS